MASLAGPSGVEFQKCNDMVRHRRHWTVDPQTAQDQGLLFARRASELVVGVAPGTVKELMARLTHAAQIDLRFGHLARQFQEFGAGGGPGDVARQRVDRFGKNRIRNNRHAQAVARPLRAVRARPGAVFGPVLARALARFALVLRGLDTPDRSLLM